MIANTLEPPRGSLRERDNRYYRWLADGAKTRPLEAFLDHPIPELPGATGGTRHHANLLPSMEPSGCWIPSPAVEIPSGTVEVHNLDPPTCCKTSSSSAPTIPSRGTPIATVR